MTRGAAATRPGDSYAFSSVGTPRHDTSCETIEPHFLLPVTSTLTPGVKATRAESGLTGSPSSEGTLEEIYRNVDRYILLSDELQSLRRCRAHLAAFNKGPLFLDSGVPGSLGRVILQHGCREARHRTACRSSNKRFENGTPSIHTGIVRDQLCPHLAPFHLLAVITIMPEETAGLS